MRIGFTQIGGASWAGGLHYLVNLLSAVKAHEADALEAVLFVGPDEDPANLKLVSPFLSQSPVINPVFGYSKAMRAARLGLATVIGSDGWAEKCFREAGVDAVFHSPPGLYGGRFKIPTIAWIPDFQHRHVIDAFSPFRRSRRDLAYRLMARHSSTVLLSSNSAAEDCRRFYPEVSEKIRVLPFVPEAPAPLGLDSVRRVMAEYALSAPYVFLPNQFWKHKNHGLVIKALEQIKQHGEGITVAVTGALIDSRNHGYPQEVLKCVGRAGLDDQFRYLGLIPRAHLFALMQGSQALLNPSLFEGWSSTVEEAKALGIPMVLSDLPVHREQCPTGAFFFDPRSPEALADSLRRVFESKVVLFDPEEQKVNLTKHLLARKSFARDFRKIIEEVVLLSPSES